MKTWLQKNKIWFETFGVVALGLAGLLMAGIQGCWAKKFSEIQNELSTDANALSEKSLELTKAELELARLQTAVAQSQVSPSFVIDMKLDEFMSVTVENKGPQVRRLSGVGTPILLLRLKDGEPASIALKNYFHFPHGNVSSSQSVTFYSSRTLYGPVVTRFAVAQVPEPTLENIANQIEAVESGTTTLPIPSDWDVQLGTVYTLTYIDATNAERQQHILCESLDKSATPIEEVPNFNVEIDVDGFKKGVWNPTYDVDALVNRVHEEIERLKR